MNSFESDLQDWKIEKRFMTIHLYHKIICGSDRFEPRCDLSKMLCELLKQRTLTSKDLEVLKKYGYIIIDKEIN